jgi:hypothetical protein
MAVPRAALTVRAHSLPVALGNFARRVDRVSRLTVRAALVQIELRS